jgi:hypothetical protein
MNPIDHIVYCIFIYSSPSFNEISENKLNEHILKISKVYNVQFMVPDSSQERLNSCTDWFTYLKRIKPKKIKLFKINKSDPRIEREVRNYQIAIDNAIEIVKENNESEFWFCIGKNVKEKYTLQLTKMYEDFSLPPKPLVDLETLKIGALEYLNKLNRIGLDTKQTKICEFFERSIIILQSSSLQKTVIPTENMSITQNQLIRVYELSGWFYSFLDWNPVELSKEKSIELDKLYSDYRIFRENMFFQVMNH